MDVPTKTPCLGAVTWLIFSPSPSAPPQPKMVIAITILRARPATDPPRWPSG